MGTCAKCGICCRFLTLPVSSFAYDIKHIAVRGGRMIGQTVFFNHPCKELAEDGKCKIYESRPRFCKSGYETHYAELKELGCKYQEDIPIAIDDGVLRIHVAEKVGSRERMM